ncbi:MAG: GlsB/YeaQ/YmgE family stress response membrane protein [Saprospiraceae bacterium]
MNWLVWIIFGLIAGAIAKWIMPGNDPGGWIVTIIIGIVGAMLGGWIGVNVLNIGAVDGFNLPSLLIAIGGAVLLLFIYRLVTGRSRV